MPLAVAADSHAMLLTMVTAISAGVLLIAVARRLEIPAIVVLLFGGVLLGPAVLGEHAPVQPGSLGDGLVVMVSIFVGLILFEGGLTLDVSGYRSAPAMIKRLLSIGIAVTWVGTAAAIFIVIGEATFEQAVIGGALVIVTGPTVIAPLLKRVKVVSRLHNILHWEGVLIDPIGVFIALLAFEWFVESAQTEAVLNLLLRVAVGLILGVGGGFAIAAAVRKKIVPDEMTNAFALGFAVLVFGLAEVIRSETGLLAMTVAGFVLGLVGPAGIKQVRAFKAEITDLLIGTLFILLASRLELEQMRDFGVRGWIVVAVVILLVRPLSIALCSWGLNLSLREKFFLSWIAPRGIVAASMASLFAIRIREMGAENPRFVETFTYSVIITTIVLQGSTAGLLARVLGLKRAEPVGWMIVGAHAFARRLAAFFSEAAKVPVVIVDTNARLIRQAGADRLPTILADARDTALQDRYEMQGVGNLLALTDNEDLNVRLCQNWGEVFGREHVFRCNPVGSEPELDEDQEETAGQVVWAKLPKPSLLSGEIVRGEARLSAGPLNDPALSQFATPLVAGHDGRVVLEPESPADSDDPLAKAPALFLQREANYLLRSIRPELIVKLKDRDIPAVIETLVDRIVRLHPTLPRDEMLGEILERESVFPTVVGHGVAVPHAYSTTLDVRVCAIARIPAGIPIGAGDEAPIRLVFLLLSPQGDPEGHLATLAEIARLVFTEETREALIRAHSPLQVIRLVRESVST